MSSALQSARPAEPFADAKARLAAAVEEALKERFAALVSAAALAADCHGEAVLTGGSRTVRDNVTLRDRFVANVAANGLADKPVLPEQMGSSDMGNVSHVLPTVHPSLAICDERVAGHSINFRDAAATPRADEVTLLASTLIAQTARELLADPALVEACWREFRGA